MTKNLPVPTNCTQGFSKQGVTTHKKHKRLAVLISPEQTDKLINNYLYIYKYEFAVVWTSEINQNKVSSPLFKIFLSINIQSITNSLLKN